MLTHTKTFTNCQSCGMPIRKDPKRGGTNADGTKNAMYCSYCYPKSAFTPPDFMKRFCKEKMKEQGFPDFLARFMVKGLSRLERWKAV